MEARIQTIVQTNNLQSLKNGLEYFYSEEVNSSDRHKVIEYISLIYLPRLRTMLKVDSAFSPKHSFFLQAKGALEEKIGMLERWVREKDDALRYDAVVEKIIGAGGPQRDLALVNKLIGPNHKRYPNVPLQLQGIDTRHLPTVLDTYGLSARDAQLLLSGIGRNAYGSKSDFYIHIITPIINALSEDVYHKSPSPNSKTAGISEGQNTEPQNPFPEIFKNGWAFKMFDELKKYTVNKKTELADYAYIWHKMHNQGRDIETSPRFAINEFVTAPIFIKFLNEKCDADISAAKLSFKDQKHKEAAYNTIYSKYRLHL